jgi:hypothetical protein
LNSYKAFFFVQKLVMSAEEAFAIKVQEKDEMVRANIVA